MLLAYLLMRANLTLWPGLATRPTLGQHRRRRPSSWSLCAPASARQVPSPKGLLAAQVAAPAHTLALVHWLATHTHTPAKRHAGPDIRWWWRSLDDHKINNFKTN